ncbi:hypothetical protein [Streptomyces sp. NPDC091299]|uniref:hypothetical protein n=1 Tax=Streptomyces sp. NPDC091299 TaxID=3155302 RepID=UPI003442DDBC
MSEPPAELIPRRDDTSADVGSLEQMGWVEEQPVPEPSTQPFLEPQYTGGTWTADEPA